MRKLILNDSQRGAAMTPSSRKRSLLFFCLIIFSDIVMILMIATSSSFLSTDLWSASALLWFPQHPTQKLKLPRVIIAMGLCVSKNAQTTTQPEQAAHLHGKKPYDVAVVLATRLWTMQFPKNDVAVVVGLGYESEEDLARVETLSRLIRNAGGIPWPIPPVTDSPEQSAKACVRAGQMARMFLHEAARELDLHGHDEVMVVTSDADIFPVNATKLLAPLLDDRNPNNGTYQAWISQHNTINIYKDRVPLGFTAMSLRDWKLAADMSGQLTLQRSIMYGVNANEYPWGVDQDIVTVLFVNRGLCQFHPSNTLWKQLQVGEKDFIDRQILFRSSTDQVNDTLTCKKGSQPHYDKPSAECLGTVNTSGRGHLCVWVHFYPTDDAQRMKSTYKEICDLYGEDGNDLMKQQCVPADELLAGLEFDGDGS